MKNKPKRVNGAAYAHVHPSVPLGKQAETLIHVFVFLFAPVLFAVLPSHTCGNPGLIPRGIIHGTRYNIGDKIRYTCMMGYVLEGHAVLTCIVSPGSGASWDFPAPFCRGKIFKRIKFKSNKK